MTQVHSQGSLFVGGSGEIIIDESLPFERYYIVVEFDPECSPPCPPPCGGGVPDELCWELTTCEVIHGHGRREEELRLKIIWQVEAPRAITWKMMLHS